MKLKYIFKTAVQTTGAFALAWLMTTNIASAVGQLAPDQSNVTAHPIDLGNAFNHITSFGVTENNGVLRMVIGKSAKPGQAPTLYYLFSQDGGKRWSGLQKLPVGQFPPHMLNRTRDPRLAVYGNHVMAIWSAAGHGPYTSGPVGTAVSSNGGKTWQPGPALGTKNSPTGHRFPSVTANKEGFHLVWINAVGGMYGMEMSHHSAKNSSQAKSLQDKKEHENSLSSHANQHEKMPYDRSLRYALLSYTSKQWSDLSIIDSTSCECCWNRIYTDADGQLLAVYRNRDPRDISLAISDDQGQSWKKITDPGSFSWHNTVCPHNGGALAFIKNGRDTTMLVTGWTGKQGQEGAYVIRGINSGNTWDKPVALKAEGQTGWHSDVAMLKDGRAVVVFDEMVDGTVQVFAITSSNSGKTWSDPVRLSAKNAHGSYPRVVGVDGQFLALWSSKVSGGKTKVVMSQIDF